MITRQQRPLAITMATVLKSMPRDLVTVKYLVLIIARLLRVFINVF